MLRLDNDRLKLLSLKDQLTLTRVCKGFRDLIVSDIWKKNYSRLNAEKGFTGSEKNRRYHKEVVNLNKEEHRQFYTLNAQNVEELTIGKLRKPELKISFYFSFKYPKLIKLFCYNDNINDDHIRILTENSPQLEILELEYSGENITGQYMKNFKSLRILNARACGIKCEFLNEIIAELHNLTILHVEYNHNLDENSVTTWGDSLRTLYISEREFYKQFTQHSLPERLGSIRVLNIDKSFRLNIDINSMKQFFTNCGEKLKTLKIFSLWQNIIDTLEEIYNNYYLSLFSRMEELHLDLKISVNQLTRLFSSTQLHSLYLYNMCDLGETLYLIQNNPKLKFICIEVENDVENLCYFINDTLESLNLLPNHPNIKLHLVPGRWGGVPKFDELQNRYGPNIFTRRSRLQIKTFQKPHKYYQSGHMLFEFHDE